VQILEAEYGTPELGNQPDPLDELIFILLTRLTPAQNAGRSWRALRERAA
jgi:hypothetical protein